MIWNSGDIEFGYGFEQQVVCRHESTNYLTLKTTSQIDVPVVPNRSWDHPRGPLQCGITRDSVFFDIDRFEEDSPDGLRRKLHFSCKISYFLEQMSLQLIFFHKTRNFQSHKATTSHQAMITQCTDRQMAPKKQKSASPEWLIFTTSCVRVRNSTPARVR